jgi:hypothetical protein
VAKTASAVDLSWAATARRPLERSLGPGWTDRARPGFAVDLVNQRLRLTVIATPWDLEDDGIEWIHASICHHDRIPDYAELKALHAAVFGGRVAYQTFVGTDRHINIRDGVLHLWGRRDGVDALPDFGRFGTI